MRKKLLLAIPVITIISALILRGAIDKIMLYGYSCDFNRLTGLWCAGCGNTRAVKALLSGNITGAIRCNAGLCVGLVLLLVLYIQLLTGKKILPDKPMPWVVLCILLLIYYVARNFVPLLAIPTLR